MKPAGERRRESVDPIQMNFQEQIILITGASNGIGRCLAIDLAARGAIVVGCGRSLERLQATAAEMQRTSPLSTAIQCDVAELDQVRAMVTGVLAKFGKIDILINNAGIGMRKPFADTPIEVDRRIDENELLRRGLLHPRSSAVNDRARQRPYREYLLRRRQDRYPEYRRLLRFKVRHERAE